jgi:hypothetical protein
MSALYPRYNRVITALQPFCTRRQSPTWPRAHPRLLCVGRRSRSQQWASMRSSLGALAVIRFEPLEAHRGSNAYVRCLHTCVACIRALLAYVRCLRIHALNVGPGRAGNGPVEVRVRLDSRVHPRREMVQLLVVAVPAPRRRQRHCCLRLVYLTAAAEARATPSHSDTCSVL